MSVNVNWSTFVRNTPLSDASFDYAAKVAAELAAESRDQGAVIEVIGDARLHRNRMAHVIRVLRLAEPGCEYRFVSDLLRYLGADQEEQA